MRGHAVKVRSQFMLVQVPLELWKADIDSAFRRVPLCPQQRQFATVAFKHKGEVLAYVHNAMPFGAIASVHAWDRIGISLRVVHQPLPCMRCLLLCKDA